MAKELLREERTEEAVELLDLAFERLPIEQIRFTDTNTYPFLEGYYAAAAMGHPEAAEKGDALLRAYAQNLIEYIEYYLRFEGCRAIWLRRCSTRSSSSWATSTIWRRMPDARMRSPS